MKHILLLLCGGVGGFVYGHLTKVKPAAVVLPQITQEPEHISKPKARIEKPDFSFSLLPLSLGGAAPDTEPPQLVENNTARLHFWTNFRFSTTADVEVFWRVNPLAAATGAKTYRDANWIAYPTAAWLALQRYEYSPSLQVYENQINGAIESVIKYRSTSLIKYFNFLDRNLQERIKKLLAVPAPTQDPKVILRTIGNTYADLDMRWQGAEQLFSKLIPSTAMGEKEKIGLQRLAESTIVTGDSLSALDSKSSVLNEDAQYEMMSNQMRLISLSSPHELSVYLSSLPKSTSWRSFGIELLLKNIPKGTPEHDVWSKQIAPKSK